MESCWAINDDYNTIIFSEEAYDKLDIITKSACHEHWFIMDKALKAYPDAVIIRLK